MPGPVLSECGMGCLESETPSVGHPVPSSTTAPSPVPRRVACRCCVTKLPPVLILGLSPAFNLYRCWVGHRPTGLAISVS